MSKKIWRGGMIGAGAWSEIQLTAWNGVVDAEIVALTDRHPERRNPVVQRYNIPQAFDDFEAMLDQAELDFVDICTRPYSHALLTKLAAERGLPVLCQKPFCENLEEATKIVEFCDQAGARLMILENFRWQAWYRQAKAVLESGALGKPFFARLHKRSRMTLPRFENRQAYLAEMPRFAVYEMGVHYLDTFRFLFGEPDSVYARTHHISPYVKGEDVQFITMGYRDLTCLINHSWASVPVPTVDKPEEEDDIAPPPRLEVDGTGGTLILLADGSMHLYSDSDHQQWQFSWDTRSESRIAVQQHFIDCLDSGADFETSGAETLKTMALVYACYLSAEENRVVELNQQ
jgi:predicted dehydrogenase